MRTTRYYTTQLAVALAMLGWVGAAQAQRAPGGGGCRGGSMGAPTPSYGTPGLGTPTLSYGTPSTGFVPTYGYGGSQNSYQQSQMAYRIAMQMEYLRQQQQADAKQAEAEAAAAETARLNKISVRQQRRQEQDARRSAAKQKRLAKGNQHDRELVQR
jgi:hypothetical protein